MRGLSLSALPLFLLLGMAHTATAEDQLPPPAKKTVDFNKDIKPILAKHCVGCHGAKKQESGFRLDTRDRTLAGGDHGVAFSVGASGKSLLIRYVGGLDPDITMPPEGDLLSRTQVGLLRAWIDQGAKWPKGIRIGGPARVHWAYTPLKRPDPPKLPPARAAKLRNSVDAFVLARLAAKGLALSPVADRHTLVRRLSLDLLGLPPSPEEVDRFVDDKTPDAYRRLVDQMLQSRHFGERWGRHWLDKARYADSDGYEKDRPRPNAWRWRDWVIDAINRDMPFDQFTVEQIAGDLLPDANENQVLATAFHRQTLTNTEGGTDKEQWRVEAVFDRVETTGAVWLGLTVGCARCHSHKYDQISQREYYQFFAFYNNGDEVNSNVVTSSTAHEKFTKDSVAHRQQLAKLEKSLATARNKLQPAFQTWLAKQLQALEVVRKDPIRDLPLTGLSAAGSADIKLAVQKDNVVLASGPNPDTAVYTLSGRIEAPSLSGLRLEVQPDKSLPKNGPGRASNGNFVVTGLKVEISSNESFDKATEVKLVQGRASFTQDKFPAVNALDGKPKTGWAIAPKMGKPHNATFFLAKPVPLKGPQHLRVTITQKVLASISRPERAESMGATISRRAPGNRSGLQYSARSSTTQTSKPTDSARRATSWPTCPAPTISNRQRFSCGMNDVPAATYGRRRAERD